MELFLICWHFFSGGRHVSTSMNGSEHWSYWHYMFTQKAVNMLSNIFSCHHSMFDVISPSFLWKLMLGDCIAWYLYCYDVVKKCSIAQLAAYSTCWLFSLVKSWSWPDLCLSFVTRITYGLLWTLISYHDSILFHLHNSKLSADDSSCVDDEGCTNDLLASVAWYWFL